MSPRIPQKPDFLAKTCHLRLGGQGVKFRVFDAFIGSGDHPRPLLNVFWKSQFLPYFSLYGPIRALKGLCSTRYWYQAVHLHPKYVPGRILGKCKVSKRSQMVQSKKLERELGHMGGVIALPSRRSENNDVFTFVPKIGHFWGVAAAASAVSYTHLTLPTTPYV